MAASASLPHHVCPCLPLQPMLMKAWCAPVVVPPRGRPVSSPTAGDLEVAVGGPSTRNATTALAFAAEWPAPARSVASAVREAKAVVTLVAAGAAVEGRGRHHCRCRQRGAGLAGEGERAAGAADRCGRSCGGDRRRCYLRR